MNEWTSAALRLVTPALLGLFASAALCGRAAGGEGSHVVLLSDDFSNGKIDPAKWIVGLPGKAGCFARVEDGVAHLLGEGTSVSLTTKAEIPPDHVVEFDYYQPGDERRGGYQNSTSFNVTQKAEGQKWDGAAWYIETGSTYSHWRGMWVMQGRMPGGFPPSSNRWYRVQVFSQADLTVIAVRDKATGELKGRVTFPHDPAVAGRVRFCAGADKGGRWGFKLDNVRIVSLVAKLSEPLAPLLPSQPPRVAKSWEPLNIAGRGFWHLARRHDYGMESLPLFAEAAWLGAPPDPKLLAEAGRPFTLRPPGSGDARARAASIARAAGTEFLGFYPPLNEWGDGFLRHAVRSKKKIASRDEGLAEMEQAYKHRASRAPVSTDIFSWLGYRLFYHQSCEWGARALIAETGEMIPCTNLQLAFMRGAAREYGKPWGVDISAWFWGRYGTTWTGTMTNYVPTPDFNNACFGPFAGHSVSLHKRISYASWLAGANYLMYEHHGVLVVNENDVRELYGYARDQTHDRWMLSPIGEVARDLFRLAKEKDRGVPCTPVAVMVDYAHGWSPSGCTPHLIWARLPLGKGDHMLDEFFNTIYPWNAKRDYRMGWAQDTLSLREQGYMVNAPFGDIFDVFTNRSTRTLDGYGAVVLVGGVRIDKALAARLAAYVRAGGTLVINAAQVGAHLSPEFLGARLIEERGADDTAVCRLDGQKLKGAQFEYTKVRLTTAEPLIVAAKNSDVLASANNVGKGRVILTTPTFLLDDKNRALPMLSHLLTHLTSGLLPVRVSPGVGWLVNKNANGWVVGLVNNKGVYKRPLGPPDVRPEEAAPVMIEFDGEAASAQEWLTNATLPCKREGGKTTVTLTVPSGDVRIVELRTK